MASTLDHTKVREELIEYINWKECSDLDLRYFRASYDENTNRKAKTITIETKSELGAIIIYMDWVSENMPNNNLWPWSRVVILRGRCESIGELSDILVDNMIDGYDDDTVLTEIGKPVTLTFPCRNVDKIET